MSEGNGTNGNGAAGASGQKRGIRFDPTINLGHMLTAAAFLVATIAAWRDLDARVSINTKEIDRVEKASKEQGSRIELDFGRRIVEQRQHMNETQVRTADDIRDMKQMMRDGFRDIDARIDRKADKPGR